MRHRNMFDIAAQILEAANGGDGVTKTKIMYSVFLNHAQLKGCLTVLTDNDLLRYDLDTHTFKTTEKGLRFLKIYNQIDDVIKAP
jgi:predicted transcriptional regulator